jgi:glycosyltransferase involved in cell wall biosynthesis
MVKIPPKSERALGRKSGKSRVKRELRRQLSDLGQNPMTKAEDQPLRICLLSYRSNPHCGGQGVYIKNLSRAIKNLGHQVEVVSGPPDPLLNGEVTVHRLPSLDLYNPEDLFRIPSLKELSDPINLLEWLGVSTMGFPEPYTFGLRAKKFLQDKYQRFDIIHDNQSLCSGLLEMQKFLPVMATIHHPITVDRRLDIQAVRSPWKKLKQVRWYSFVGMQIKVARKIPKIITVSECAGDDISREFDIPRQRFKVVPNGIDTDLFHPLPEIEREKNRLIVTNSADTPLKGLDHLLKAVYDLSKTHPLNLTVVGEPKKDSRIFKLIRELDLGRLVTFTGRIDNENFVRWYARSAMAVIPSLYEGFGLPAGEAMACGVPVISTSGGALPEVVGEAGVIVPPGDPTALAAAIKGLLDNPDRARELGEAGLKRVYDCFTWEKAARATVDVYRETIEDGLVKSPSSGRGRLSPGLG